MAKVTIRLRGKELAKQEKIRNLGKQLDVNESIESLLETMRKFEERYGMSTLEFYARFAAGKMGDSRDFIKWAGAFDLYNRLLQTHFQPHKKVA
ncbi:MAG: hypothetical protein MOB07_20870 [Acidobacteria bacterium]|nr:hypothetical protein [Acidobacteriota bacterium]